MPDDKRPELDEYQKEKDEFAGAIDDIFAEDSKLTDEEINKKLDEELGKRPDTASGDATGDPEVDPDKPLVDPDKYSIDPDNKPDTDTTDWKVRAEAAEVESAKANQKMSSWDGRITAANKRVKELETELEQAKVSKPSEQDLSDTEKIEEFRKDFPELVDVVDVMERRFCTGGHPMPEIDLQKHHRGKQASAPRRALRLFCRRSIPLRQTSS